MSTRYCLLELKNPPPKKDVRVYKDFDTRTFRIFADGGTIDLTADEARDVAATLSQAMSEHREWPDLS